MKDLDVPAVSRNIVVILQENPLRYRNFGIWWWPVKAILKSQFTRQQLPLLGDYVDAAAAARIPDIGLQAMLRAALEEYGQNARYNLGRNTVTAPDGEVYVIYDDDAGA